MQKITPSLWFNNNAEEAIEFYTSVFEDASMTNITRYGAGGPAPEGQLMTATFRLAGQEFMALNGGPMFRFTEAISLFVHCDTQEEVDRYWEQLSAGGKESQCGWLKDRFGLSWQIIPSALGRLLGDKDREKAGRVLQAMLQMKKIDISRLEAAYAGE